MIEVVMKMDYSWGENPTREEVSIFVDSVKDVENLYHIAISHDAYDSFGVRNDNGVVVDWVPMTKANAAGGNQPG